ncbi:MAG: hypothetical protein FWF82_04700 [Oscillospiraceae bacterium]|nr:hypothetical protein [Oscillospiraceae bacterium]
MNINAYNTSLFQKKDDKFAFSILSKKPTPKTTPKSVSDRITALMNKLRSGQKLTAAELSELREFSMELYGEANRIMKQWEKEEERKEEEAVKFKEDMDESRIEKIKQEEKVLEQRRQEQKQERERKRDSFVCE